MSSSSIAGSSSVSLRITSPDSWLTSVANLLLKSLNSLGCHCHWLHLLYHNFYVQKHQSWQLENCKFSKYTFCMFWCVGVLIFLSFLWASLRLSLSHFFTASVHCFLNFLRSFFIIYNKNSRNMWRSWLRPLCKNGFLNGFFPGADDVQNSAFFLKIVRSLEYFHQNNCLKGTHLLFQGRSRGVPCQIPSKNNIFLGTFFSTPCGPCWWRISW